MTKHNHTYQIPRTNFHILPTGLRSQLESHFSPSHSDGVLEILRSCKISEALKSCTVLTAVASGVVTSASPETQLPKAKADMVSFIFWVHNSNYVYIFALVILSKKVFSKTQNV